MPRKGLAERYEVQHTFLLHVCLQALTEMCLIGTVNGNRSTCGSVKTIASLNVVATRCRSCGSLTCQCSPQNGYTYESCKSKFKMPCAVSLLLFKVEGLTLFVFYSELPSARYSGQHFVALKSVSSLIFFVLLV